MSAAKKLGQKWMTQNRKYPAAIKLKQYFGYLPPDNIKLAEQIRQQVGK